MVEQSKIIWNPYTPGYFENPYNHLNECREQNPIHIGVHNSWLFFKYKDVSEMLRSPDFDVTEISDYLKGKEQYIFKNSNQCPYLSQGTKLWSMYLNGDTHKKVRLAMGKAINALPLEKILKESIEECHLKYANSTGFNLVDYCCEFIFLVVKKLFGITDYESLARIKQYSNLLAISQDIFIPKQIYLDINAEFLWGKEIFSNSPYRKLIESSLEDENLSKDDIYSIMSLSLMAAFESSKDNLSLSLYEILKQPKLIDTILESNKQEINLVIEELLRFSSPVQYTIRINKKPLLIDGINIETNSKLFLCLASANRDPIEFSNPDEIIVDRENNSHLTFGGGTHFCLGATISRQELRHCIKPMLQFLSNYKIDDSQPIKWSKQILMRTVEQVAIVPK